MRPQTQCSVPGCARLRYKRSWCNPHYIRWRRHGDPEGGFTSHGDGLRFIAEVAMNYTADDCLVWPLGRISSGYATVWIEGGPRLVHRHICELVHGSPPSPKHEAAHSCGNGHLGCINPKHIGWKTTAENAADKILHGTHRRGERNPRVKLTERDVTEIRSLKGSATQRALAKRFGISQQMICRIQNGLSWGWL